MLPFDLAFKQLGHFEDWRAGRSPSIHTGRTGTRLDPENSAGSPLRARTSLDGKCLASALSPQESLEHRGNLRTGRIGLDTGTGDGTRRRARACGAHRQIIDFGNAQNPIGVAGRMQMIRAASQGAAPGYPMW